MKRLLNTVYLFFAALLLSSLSMSVFAASAAEELQKELDNFNTLTANFEQRVSDSEFRLIDQQKGKLFLKQPGKFKWQYTDQDQDIVSDGKTIFFVMRDLEQVIKKDFANAVSSVPSLVLVTDPSKLTELYAVEKLSGQSGVTRFELLPKSLDSNYESVTVSFLNGNLQGLRFTDVLGQTTEVILSGAQNNPKISNSEFKVKIPKGFDVIEG